MSAGCVHASGHSRCQSIANIFDIGMQIDRFSFISLFTGLAKIFFQYYSICSIKSEYAFDTSEMRYGRQKKERMKDFCSCGTCSELLTLCCLQVEEMRHKIPSTYGSEIKLQQSVAKKRKNFLTFCRRRRRRQKEKKMQFLFEMQLNYDFLVKNLLKYFFQMRQFIGKRLHCCQRSTHM